MKEENTTDVGETYIMSLFRREIDIPSTIDVC